MRKLFLLLLSVLALVGSSWAQQGRVADFVRVDTILNFTSEHTSMFTHLARAEWNGLVAFTNFSTYNKCDTVVVYTIDVATYKVDTLRLYSKGICKYIRKRRNSCIRALAMTDRYLVLGLFHELLLFEKKEGVFVGPRHLAYAKSYETMQFVDDHTLMTAEVYHSRKTDITLIDLDKMEVTHSIAPHLNSSLTSLFGTVPLTAVSKGCILWGHTFEYSFVEYGPDLVLRDSTHRNFDSWVSLKPETLQMVAAVDNRYPVNKIDLMRPEWNNIDQLAGLYMLDDDHLMVFRNTGSTHFSMVDVWGRQGDRWVPVRQDLLDGGWYADKDSVITASNYALGLPFGDKLLTTGGKIVALSSSGCVLHPIGMTTKAYSQERNDYLSENEHFVQVRIYSQKF